MPILIPDEINREDLISHLKNRKIQSSIHYQHSGHSKLINQNLILKIFL